MSKTLGECSLEELMHEMKMTKRDINVSYGKFSGNENKPHKINLDLYEHLKHVKHMIKRKLT